MQNNLDMIGNFYTSQDVFKFVMESINDSTANIRFLNSGITNKFQLRQLKVEKFIVKLQKVDRKRFSIRYRI